MSEFLYTCESCGEQMDEGESSPCTCCRLAASRDREAKPRDYLQRICAEAGSVMNDPDSFSPEEVAEHLAEIAGVALAAGGEGGGDE